MKTKIRLGKTYCKKIGNKKSQQMLLLIMIYEKIYLFLKIC